MTFAEYKARYGKQLQEHQNDDWFAALLQTCRDSHIMKAFRTEKGDNLLLQGAPIYLNQIFGYESLLTSIESLLIPEKTEVPEPPSDYPDEKPEL